MLTTIIILAILVTLVSFDGSWSSVFQSQRNELVFTGRNTEYGAYKLRRENHKSLLTGLVISSFTLGITCFALMYSPAVNIDQSMYDPATPQDITLLDIKEKQPEIQPDLRRRIEPRTSAAPIPQGTEVQVVDNNTPAPAPAVISVASVQGPVNLPGTEGPSSPGLPAGNPAPAVDPDPNKVEIFVDVLPEYPGGMGAMKEFLRNKVRYNDWEIETGVQGTIWITFVVLKNGEVGDVRVERGIRGGARLEKLCLKAMKEMPQWKPGTRAGVAVNALHRIPIEFKLRNE